jgi:hypothetical protein
MGRHQSINSLVNSMTRLDVARLDLLLAGHERLTFAVLRLPISAPSREIISGMSHLTKFARFDPIKRDLAAGWSLNQKPTSA